MADHYFKFPGDLNIHFQIAGDIGSEEQIMLGAYVPGISFLMQKPQRIDLTVNYIKSNQAGLEDDGTHITLSGPEEFPADLYHFLYGIERRALLARNLYPVHASCVGQDNNYILIVGHSGAGKTTLAHNLVEHHGLKLFSGNKTVLQIGHDGDIKAIAGTRIMTALDRNLQRHSYEMAAEQYAPEPVVSVKSIALVKVNDGIEEAQKLNNVSALHTLYPYFMDAVNSDVIVNDAQVFDGSIGTEAKIKLVERLSCAVKSIPVFKFSGPMPYLERKVRQS